MKMRLLAAPAWFAALIAVAATAQADTGSDSKFLAGLKSAGISYKSEPDAVGSGRKACELMDQGHAQADIVKAMIDQNPGFTTDGANTFVQIAENDLCPQHTGGASTPPAPANAPSANGPNANGTYVYDPGTAGASGGGAPAGGGG